VAYGAIDELNSALGVAIVAVDRHECGAWLRAIQNDLFDLGADLCVPEPAPQSEDEPAPAEPSHPPLRITASQVTRLEAWIDAANDPLKPLTSFVLPGGSDAAAHLHVARSVCRRAEINVLHLAEFDSLNEQTHIYLNRLSDLLFVLARVLNNDGKSDVLWVPGANR
jgi:cob(I)alamin adenosyltransferase